MPDMPARDQIIYALVAALIAKVVTMALARKAITAN
jgi:hypothetical protein